MGVLGFRVCGEIERGFEGGVAVDGGGGSGGGREVAMEEL